MFDPLDTFPQRFLDSFLGLHPRQEYGTPRWSGIAGCARDQFYSITGAPPSLYDDGRSTWVAEKGYDAQRRVLGTLEAMGHTVVVAEGREGDDCSADIPPWVTGHIDAEVVWADRPQYGTTILDVKARNYLAYVRWATQPLFQADVSAYFQMQGYLASRKRSIGSFIVVAHDPAATKGQMTRSKLGVHPVMFRMFLRGNAVAQELGLHRAEALCDARDAGLLVQREFNPESGRNWQCDYCDYKSLCLAAGSEGVRIPHWNDGDYLEWMQTEDRKVKDVPN